MTRPDGKRARRTRGLRRASVAACLVTLVGLGGGCTRRGGIPILNFLPIGKPVVFGLVTDNPLDAVNPFSPFDAMLEALSRELSRPVHADLYLPFQLRGNLRGGACQFALTTPAQFAQLEARSEFEILAVACDASGRTGRAAVAVVKEGSEVREIGALRGKSVVFGPAGDSRAHWAALELLARHGVRPGDLALELLPIPGSLRHALTPALALEAVAQGGAAAAFVDETAWQDLPARPGEGGSERTQEGLRILGRTLSLPELLVVASPKSDAALRERVTSFLLRADRAAPEALRPLRFSRFEKPPGPLAAALEQLAAVVAPRGESRPE